MNYNDVIRLGELLQTTKDKFLDPTGWDESMDAIDLIEAFNEDGAIGDWLNKEDRIEFKLLIQKFRRIYD